MPHLKHTIRANPLLLKTYSLLKNFINISPTSPIPPLPFAASYNSALSWITRNSLSLQGGQSVIFHSARREPYPEVTGYLIPTLLKAGLPQLARKYGAFLISTQQQSGAWLGADGRPRVFDTAQALKGLHALLLKGLITDTVKKCLLSGYKYILKHHPEKPTPSIPPLITLYDFPFLEKLAPLLEQPLSFLNFVLTPDEDEIEAALSPSTLTHFLGYIIEGLIDLDLKRDVRPYVKQILKTQRKDGSIPAFKGAKWVCNVGVAQFAIIALKMGYPSAAYRCLEYMRNIQRPSGGFFGSHGAFASYFTTVEISWANKFYLDALHLSNLGASTQ